MWSYCTASLPCPHICQLLSQILAFLQPQYWAWPESMGTAGSRQEQAVLPSRHTQLGERRYVLHGYGLLLQKRQCPQTREIQPCVSKYKEQQTLLHNRHWELAFNIFDFYCCYLHLCWLLIIKLSRHFLYVFFKAPPFNFPQHYFFVTFLSSGLFPYLFSLYLSLCPLIIFLKSQPQELKHLSILLHGKWIEICGNSRVFSLSSSACRIYPFLKWFLSLLTILFVKTLKNMSFS